jgi:hypothetical protein
VLDLAVEEPDVEDVVRRVHATPTAQPPSGQTVS